MKSIKKQEKKTNNLPFVSICTPTFNRRPFIPMIIKCFQHQTYPVDKMEWIIVDDGTDPIEDLVKDIPQIKYYKFTEKMCLGKKRNICHEMSKGDIIVNMDDDDYYPPERVNHAVSMLLSNPTALCGGSSLMHIYFKHIHKMYECGPYGENHATAATFAFKRELLKQTSFSDNASIAEEKFFLKNNTVPFVQFDSRKTILVFSHSQNSFDKKDLLNQPSNKFFRESMLSPNDFIKEPDILQFFMHDIDDKLANYHSGNISFKPDVTKQMTEIIKKKEDMIRKNQEYQNIINKIQHLHDPKYAENKIAEMTQQIYQLTNENNQLTNENNHLREKLKQIITEKINEKRSSL
jgi:glycosyltransferase involved in cell wall biosynthesis